MVAPTKIMSTGSKRALLEVTDTGWLTETSSSKGVVTQIRVRDIGETRVTLCGNFEVTNVSGHKTLLWHPYAEQDLRYIDHHVETVKRLAEALDL